MRSVARIDTRDIFYPIEKLEPASASGKKLVRTVDTPIRRADRRVDRPWRDKIAAGEQGGVKPSRKRPRSAKVHPTYPNIFSPIKLGPVELPNRFYFGPHGNQMTAGTAPSRDYAYYVAERARNGGAGLIVTAHTLHERSRQFQSTAYTEANVPSFRAMADAVHEAGSKIFAEVWYAWVTPGNWQPLGPAAPAMSASANQLRRNTRTVSTHEMTNEEVWRAIGAYRQCVANLRAAGYDGVMIHAAHAALAEQFLSPYFNRRTDEFGGSLENRMRFLVEVLKAAREEGGSEFAVGMRFNCDELLNGGYGADVAREVITRVREAGLVDYLDLDVAVEPNQFHLGMPSVFVAPQVYRPYIEKVRSAVGDTPVLSVLGRITSLADAEAALADGVCDVVGAARALIAEPELVSNARAGREDQNRVCIACNWCLAAPAEGAHGCTINPASYRERLWGVETLTPAASPSRVVVVGSGPAGLEAARVSAHRGHQVTLFEARDRLGGGMALWSTLPGRDFLRHNIDWWGRELKRLGVTVRCGVEATAEMVLAEHPDAVIVATGSLYSERGNSAFDQADIPGAERAFVYRPEDILVRGVRPKGKVVVLDCEGLHTGVGVSEILGRAGAQVEHLTPELMPVSIRLLESQEAEFIMKRLDEAGVSISTATYISSIGNRQVATYNVFTDKTASIDDVDAVVLCTGRVPVDSLAKQLEGKVAQLFCVGDALAARLLAHAPYEGQKFARYIGEPDAPRSVADAFFAPNSDDLAVLPAETLLRSAG
jgi:2,4-dienoyl-CoA reductase-like NADH-dependent reductase (Old Yellow Enzyme family)